MHFVNLNEKGNIPHGQIYVFIITTLPNVS